MNVLKKLSTILFPNTEEPYQISDPTAVKFDAQELTESQQMQARKNLGVYGKYQSEISVIGEQDVSFSLREDSNIEYKGAIVGDVPALNVSDEYIVMWDEAEYRCTAYESAGNVFIGDTSIFDGSNSGDEPFVMQFFAGQGIMIDTLEDGSTHKVGLTKIGETINPIPPEYLPGTFVPTAIIKSSDYDNALAGVSTMASDPEASDASYECINMTFEEAMQYVTEGRQLTVCLMFVLNSIPTISNASVQLVSENGERFLYAYTTGSSSFGLVWKSDGLTKN